MTEWHSPREALAYLYACQRGPGLTQLSQAGVPGLREFRDPLDHVMVGALLYGPLEDGFCAVKPGGDLDRELRDWAQGGLPRSARVRRIERKIRELLRKHKLKSESTNVKKLMAKYADGGHFLLGIDRPTLPDKND